jgi:cytidylate kinase
MSADLITISREYGAGAGELAALLGERLGWRVLDKEIPIAVATQLGIPRDSLEPWDEHSPGLLETIGGAFMLGSPDLLIDPEYAGRPQAGDIAAATRSLLIDAVASPPLIVVGHGGQAIFRDRRGSLHLRLVAPLARRVPRIMARKRCTEKEAVAIAHHVDRDRAHYVKDFLGCDVTDPHLYALQINTGMVTMAHAVDLVLRLL